MRTTPARRRAFLLVLIGLVVPLGGCLVSTSSSERRTGNFVADSTFSKIEPGKTTAGWVQATLGEPSSRETVPADHSEVWKYTYTEKKNSSGSVFLLFGGSDSKERTGHAFVEIKDGVVVNKWRG